jgi:hypothetical protein
MRSMKTPGQGYAVPMPLEDIPCGCLVYLAIWAVIAWVLKDSITGLLGISPKDDTLYYVILIGAPIVVLFLVVRRPRRYRGRRRGP